MSNLSDFQLRAILKSTEELVTQARLDQISKEHQSIGSILDNRCLYPIEEPKKRDRSHTKQEIEKRLHSRRGGRGEFDIKLKADQAVEAFKDKGVNVEMLVGNYQVEQQIWKEKSAQASYSQKRKYQYPELQQFKDSMPPIQQNLFKEKISEAIIQLADRYREECRALKVDMDLNGVFHPEANAHRVHCIYLMKLYKGIKSETIEDPILRRFMAEKAELARSRKEEDDRKEKLMQIFESVGGAGVKKQDIINVEKELALHQTTSSDRNAGETAKAMNSSSQQRRIKKAQNNTQNKRLGHKLAPISASKQPLRSLSMPNVANATDAQNAGGVSPHNKSPLVAKEGDGVVAEEESTSRVSVAEKLHNKTSDKLFRKMKRERLGGSESRSILIDEAARLDRGEVVQTRRQKDKNSVLDTEMSSWMLSTLQKTQISKTSGGTSLLTAGSLSTQQHRPVPVLTTVSPVVMEFAKSLSASELSSPQKMMPFQQFYAMFQTYSVATDPAPASQHQSVYFGENVKTSADKAEKVQTAAEATSTAGGRKRSTSMSSSQQSSPVKGSKTPGNAGGDELSRPVETVNIVKQLAEQDPNFESYMKVAHKEQPPALLRTNTSSSKGSALLKPRRMRKVAPLGKDAMQLKDSRGRVSKDSFKGFSNHFKVHEASRTEEQEEEDADKLKSDDLLGRLRSLQTYDDQDDDSVGDSPANTDSQRSPTAFSPGRGRLSRGRSRTRNSQASFGKAKHSLLVDDGIDGDLTTNDSDAVFEMQDKLLAIWDALQVSTLTRIAFMRKYSSEAYSVEMSRAVDIWGEAAVYVVLLQELGKVAKKIKSGLLQMPFELSALVMQLKTKVPPLLATASHSLVPASLSDVLQSHHAAGVLATQSVPLSFAALRTARKILESSFASQLSEEEAGGPMAVTDVLIAAEVVSSAMESLAAELRVCHKKVSSELDDVVFVGAKSCREWLLLQDLRSNKTPANVDGQHDKQQ